MKTTILIAQSYGQADVLEYYTQELPKLASGMTRIQVKAAGINPIDARRMTGEFKHSALPQTFGTEFSGVIVEVNSNLSSWSIGDEVLGSGGSFTHATIIDVPNENLIKRPQSISWEVAGSLAGASQTAMTILDEIGKVNSLLVHGASGGVGSITVQLAKSRGIEVVATASARNQEYLKSLGVTPIIYGQGLTERLKEIHPDLFDASIDMSGTEEAAQTSLECVKPDGFIGSIAGKRLSSPRIQAVWVKRNPSNLKYVVDGIAEGHLKWNVDENNIYPFEKAADAYDNILKGHTRGKIVLVF
ncbi:NADP-dependent oxidoreductase [Dysgonomonas sp. Marseille-P4677]|uniref:NADP-dependent oxidoreductase n=1 Tax=Dysgonomonas sp. Marseille-P4677 TaxID=2364790 RepID=UPI0019121459|nr:NADP-dependent oxidoreductase [Dysgonomonas sp. Marseille-P4677]MBK5720741.1 NADP-dependent oxidoreductase [Dysgonomonas sp. Marseille-P4677]